MKVEGLQGEYSYFQTPIRNNANVDLERHTLLSDSCHLTGDWQLNNAKKASNSDLHGIAKKEMTVGVYQA